MNENLQPESPETALQEANRQQALDALEERGALRPCEACGGEFTALGLRALLQLVGEGGVIQLGEGGEMVVTMCRNCGLMRLHAATLLFENDDEGGDDAAG